MRELQFTQKILNKALAQVSGTKRIKDVNLVIGEIAELDTARIEQYWRELGKGTSAEHAQLHFRFIKADVQCMACFEKYHPVNGEIHCPYCGSYGAKILSGEEFDLESMVLDDD
jgi:hydrogenase nickel incorporation protein HypA/HybF